MEKRAETGMGRRDDAGTARYFETFTPRYGLEKFAFALHFIRERYDGGSLLDVGCGDGAALELFAEETALDRFAGLDISPAYLRKTAERVGCETLHGSVLDPEIVQTLEGRFDICVMASVLHHLVGDNRRQSAVLARTALRHALRTVHPGGHLLIYEPTYTSGLVSTAIFWLKKAVSRYSGGRVEVGPSWMNVGLPVVSYYSPRQLRRMARRLGRARLLTAREVDSIDLAAGLSRDGWSVILERQR